MPIQNHYISSSVGNQLKYQAENPPKRFYREQGETDEEAWEAPEKSEGQLLREMTQTQNLMSPPKDSIPEELLLLVEVRVVYMNTHCYSVIIIPLL